MAIDIQIAAVEIEHFIRYYVPKGWRGPIKEFDFAPLLSEEDAQIITNGKIPEKPEYQKWYVRDAIYEYWKRLDINKKI